MAEKCVIPSWNPVSYTHLDVYKRQFQNILWLVTPQLTHYCLLMIRLSCWSPKMASRWLYTHWIKLQGFQIRDLHIGSAGFPWSWSHTAKIFIDGTVLELASSLNMWAIMSLTLQTKISWRSYVSSGICVGPSREL